MAEVTFNPKSHYMTVSQEVVSAFFECREGSLAKTIHWWTAHEVAMKTGLTESVAATAIRQLTKAGVLKKRRREGGFDNGILEFRHQSHCKVIGGRRTEAFMGQIVGCEPLERKLKRLLGLRRAREAELIFK